MSRISGRSVLLAAWLNVWGAGTVAAAPPVQRRPDALAVPGGEAGVGYDDLQYAPDLGRILAPAGRTGRLVLVDPATKQLSAIAGFSGSSGYRGGHGEGTTSATELGGGLIAATDRGTKTVKVVNAKSAAIVSSVKLAAAPDYVRAVPATNEVWVTEPSRKQIEVLRVERGATPKLAHAATFSVPDGPESLVVDAGRGRAYTHAWTGETYAIDLRQRKVVASWRNGCRQSRGIALDAQRGLLFAGCAEGGATVVDLASAKVVASAPTGADVDSVGYAPALGHLYVPSGASADLSVFAVSADGKLTSFGRLATAADAHTVAYDPATGTVFVGSPAHGEILVIRDPFPPSPK
jgi:DNA-binding beta-propeller fold protein YncE